MTACLEGDQRTRPITPSYAGVAVFRAGPNSRKEETPEAQQSREHPNPSDHGKRTINAKVACLRYHSSARAGAVTLQRDGGLSAW